MTGYNLKKLFLAIFQYTVAILPLIKTPILKAYLLKYALT